MYFNNEDLIFCLGKAKEMSEHYKLNVLSPDRTKRSIDDLHSLCSEYLQKKVEIHELNLPAGDNEIRGLYMANSDGTFDIYVLAELGVNEQRFVRCKELFHVILDQDKCRSMDIYNHLESTTASFAIINSTPNSPVAWEVLAEIAAMEFMFPYVERIEVLKNNPDFAELARRYGIPQYMIELYLSSPSMEYLNNID